MTIGAGRLGVAGLLLAALALAGCHETRDQPLPPSVFADVNPILEEHCLECHSGPEAEADYRVETYLETIRCVPSEEPPPRPATLPPDETAPILAVLEREDVHSDLLDPNETEALATWVFQGAFPMNRSTHPGQWLDPRTTEWHGNYLRETDWQPIVDPTREDACGLCHPGSPAPVPGIINFPPGATDCTDCHDMPGGVMACGTCHGDEERPYPPRDQCYFPGEPFGGAHTTHTEPSANMPRPLDCSACHFGENFLELAGTHGDGKVDVVFQPAWGGEDATYDFETLECATTCHTRGGEGPEGAWNEQLDLECNACHQNPPAGHSTIACNSCHRGINAAGTRLTIEAPHINGRVDAF